MPSPTQAEADYYSERLAALLDAKPLLIQRGREERRTVSSGEFICMHVIPKHHAAFKHRYTHNYVFVVLDDAAGGVRLQAPEMEEKFMRGEFGMKPDSDSC